MKLKSLVLIILLLLAARAGRATTYIVVNTNDSGGGSLRQAIINANSSPTVDDAIEFNIAGAGVKTIVPLTDLPPVQANLTIDGTTQPGYAGTPLIEINAVNVNYGLRFLTSGTFVVRGLIVNRAASHGFDVGNGFTTFIDLTITACYIGTNSTGAGAAGNGGDGIHFGGGGSAANTLTIGGSTAADRNVISGNAGDGIFLNGAGSALIYNNYIGTNASGTIDLGNSGDGVDVQSSSSSTVAVGGTNNNLSLNLGNVISGNNGNGLRLGSQGSISVQRNLIGTNAAGTNDLGNSQNGILITIGDPLIGSSSNSLNGNVISGNGGDVDNGNGIALTDFADGAQIYANKIGTNAAGTAALQNDAAGIFLGDSSNNRIGLAGNATARNTIGGNFLHGIVLSGAGSTGNAIENNFIGTNASGTNLGNGGDGILLTNVSTPTAGANTIGGATAGAGNTIAFNRNGHGIEIAAAWTGISIQNNSIFQNLGSGVYVPAAGATGNSIRLNAIYSNLGLGIDLGVSGVTPNDANDGDAGANNLQNFPVLQSVTPARIAGTLNSGANQTYTLDFYRVDSCDSSGNGQGRYYLASTDVTTTGSSVSFNYAYAGLAVGQIVTATATDANGNTSEFSACRTAATPGDFQFTTAAQTIAENGISMSVTVSRTGGAQGTVTVDYTTVDGTATAGQDYALTSGTLTLLNGEVSKSFVIIIFNDPTDEPDETFSVALGNPTNGALLASPSTQTVTITDNDSPPTIAISDVSLKEGNAGTTNFGFTVSLVRASAFPVTVDFATADGTATAGIDYATTNGTLTFAPGETTKPVPVAVTGELTVEIDETFFVNLANPTNATLADAQGTGTILDDDNPGRLQFAASPYTGAEGGGNITLTVTRTNGDAGTVTVDYFTTGGTATPTVDYQTAAGTLTFLNGETAKTFVVTPLQDAQVEPTENFNVVLANPVGGASLGPLATTSVNILDDDAGALLAIGGRILKADTTPLAGAAVSLQGTQTASATTDANGDFTFANLAPNGNFTVTPAALGYTFAPAARFYSNLAANVANANFTATPAPTRQLRVLGGDAAPGAPVAVAVELVAQGDENAVGFTLVYDAAVLSGPTVVLNPDAAAAVLTVNPATAGRLGIVLSLPAGQSFAAGTKSLVTATFNTTPGNLYSSPVTFGDAPVLRQIVNINADPLPANYTDGQVTFAQGYEADVAPRPTGSGNGTVTVADFTQVGRFVAGLDTPAQLNEFQRADSAPRVAKGNGVVSVADYTQAGRFAAGLDVVQTAGGQTAPGFLAGAIFADEKRAAPGFAPTVVRVVTTPAVPGTQVTVVIETVANGDENGFGFSLAYDPAKLSNPLVARGADTPTATLIPNTTTAGRVGVVLGMPFGQGIAAGVRQLVTVRFDVAANAPAGPAPLVTGDLPVFREVADVNGNAVAATFQDGAVNISVATAAGVAVGGRVAAPDGAGLAQARVTLTDSNGAVRTALTNSFGAFRFEDVPAGAVYTLEVRHKTYRFAPRVLTVTDELTDLTVVAEDGD